MSIEDELEAQRTNRLLKQQEYKRRKLEKMETNVPAKSDGSVNVEYFMSELFKNQSPNDSRWTLEKLEEFCKNNEINFEKVKLYLLFS